MWFFDQAPNHFPKGSGNYVPGVADVMLDYERSGIFMRFYYPSDGKVRIESDHTHWPPAMPDYDYIVGLSNVAMMPTFLLNLAWLRSGKIRIPADYGAKIVGEGTLKVIVFSHGLGALRSFYSSIAVELASHGYLVAVIEHRDESACHTHFYDSPEAAAARRKTSIAFQKVPLGKGHLDARKEQVLYRKSEMLKAVDFFAKLHAGIVPHNVMDDVGAQRGVGAFSLEDLVGRIDVKGITLAGHSFGAATALLALSERPELKCGVLLDPWMFPIKGMRLDRKVEQRLLFINTETFHIDSNVRAMSQFWRESDATREMFTISKSTHENQTDSVLIAGYWLNWFMKKIDPKLALRINNSMILKHLNLFGGGSADATTGANKFLEEHTEHYVSGLTSPWA